jgi:hypothetical protein
MPDTNARTPEHAQANQMPQSDEPVPNGSAAAAILSAAAGSCALGILAVIADGSKTVARWLTFYLPTGPLSGVTSVAILAWLVIWLVLSNRWRNKSVNLSMTNGLAFFLLALALLLTFPPFADLLLGR